MALQAVEAGRGRFLHEQFLEVLVGQPEGHVHARSTGLDGVRSPERRSIELRIEDVRLALVDLLNLGEAAAADQPLEYEPQNVDAEYRRRVVERPILR